jgi:hypothetical protein
VAMTFKEDGSGDVFESFNPVPQTVPTMLNGQGKFKCRPENSVTGGITLSGIF